jgi:hypothetical protein
VFKTLLDLTKSISDELNLETLCSALAGACGALSRLSFSAWFFTIPFTMNFACSRSAPTGSGLNAKSLSVPMATI